MNRIFKKLIGAVLILTLVLSSVLAAAENSAENIKGEALNEAMEVLRLFSIIPDYYDYSVDTTENVPRADFVSGVAKMTGFTEYNGAPYYYDVPENHYAFKEISALTQKGILSGVGNKLFRPDEPITKEEGYKIIMTVLGYGDWAEYNGGYPAGYMSAANRAKVTDGVSANPSVTVSDMINIFYNAICTSVLEPTSFGGESATYTTEEGNTLLSIYRDIYYREGRMTGVNQMSFDGTTIEDGEVIIDDVVYKTESDVSEYLGEEVKLFYHYNAKDEIRTIQWVCPLDRADTLYLDADNDMSFEKETYTLNFYENDMKKKLVLDRALLLVYNGSIVTDGISEILNMPKYDIKLVKGNEGRYSVAVVSAYENYVAGNIDALENIVYDKAEASKAISLNPNNYERLTISLLGKTPISFEEIKAGNVLSVFLSKDKRYANVHVSVDVVSGVTDNVRNDSDGTIVLIDAIEYFIPKYVKDSDVKAGQNVKFYLDTKGEVAYVEKDTSAYTPAYLIDAAESSEGLSKTLKFRVLNKKGEVVEMDCADVVKIDGTKYKDVSKACNYLMPDGEFKPQFTMIRANSDGKIVMIDTTADNPDTTDDDVLQVSVPLQGSVTYRNKCLGHKAIIDGNTVIFSLGDDIKNDEVDKFSVMSSLTDWKTYQNVETYKVQDRVGYEQFVIVQGHNTSMYWESDIPVLVCEFSELMNEDGEIIEAITCYQGASEKEIALKEGLSLRENGVEKGDVLRLKMNSDGTADDYTMIYDYSKGGENVIIGGYASATSFSVGYVTDYVDGVIKIGKAPGENDISIYTAGVPCVIYDKDAANNEIYTGDIASAKTFYNEGVDCSMVVLTQTYTTPKSFIIFK